jgi:hypothetical protein
MNFAWAIQMMREDAFTLPPLRLVASIEIAQAPESIWVRGRAGDSGLDKVLQALPATGRFEWLPDGRLRSLNSRIPSQSLPPLQWEPIAQWLRVKLPVVARPGTEPRPIELSLVRSGAEKTCNVLLTDLAAWQHFVLNTSEIRLRPLRYALKESGDVVIWGAPLPPIAGRRFVEQEAIAVPAGFAWEPAVSPKILRQVFEAGENALVIWAENGCVHLHPEQLVPATRSGVRATVQTMRSGK